ncbi:hypothetical protein SAMD00019534_039150 [Acytostelium subglobosum LB1]|uniref:hypothetical protein n=1 Tax=Acytostelium subglobosum LB1 TaxID=1410327 RepID=UPI000644FE62|nr:hypothetical protein SAMD00019534_039150 [Acytostelium subglobosum LB1]GAM20740.1 hypothetical protein SAMD00019534_039150 [Acytostelium subglobosum LB1]|eukprot:XP_012755874.1 hypothetical protein SAMD00019534_039150 [Acytostelium subglobosum LB1]
MKVQFFKGRDFTGDTKVFEKECSWKYEADLKERHRFKSVVVDNGTLLIAYEIPDPTYLKRKPDGGLHHIFHPGRYPDLPSISNFSRYQIINSGPTTSSSSPDNATIINNNISVIDIRLDVYSNNSSLTQSQHTQQYQLVIKDKDDVNIFACVQQSSNAAANDGDVQPFTQCTIKSIPGNDASLIHWQIQETPNGDESNTTKLPLFKGQCTLTRNQLNGIYTLTTTTTTTNVNTQAQDQDDEDNVLDGASMPINLDLIQVGKTQFIFSLDLRRLSTTTCRPASPSKLKWMGEVSVN